MGKIMNTVMSITSIGCLAATTYMVLKSKKNMLDVIMEEIETMK